MDRGSRRVRPVQFLFVLLISGLVAVDVASAQVTGQDFAFNTRSASEQLTDFQVHIGFDGVWKLGQVTPICVSFDRLVGTGEGDAGGEAGGAVDAEPQARLVEQLAAVTDIEVVAIDGDGVEVTYRKRLATDDQEPSALEASSGNRFSERRFRLPVRIGRRAVQLTVRLLAEQRVLAERQMALAEETGGLASDQPLVLALGDAMGIEQLARRSADGSTSSFTTATFSKARWLPTGYRDYAAIDLLVLSTADIDFLRAIREPQWDAIEDWIRRGGNCCLSLSGRLDRSQAPDRLLDLLPGRLGDSGRVSNPGAIESMVVSEQRLAGFAVARLELERGNTRLALNDTLGRRVPWWVNYSLGHGTVTLVAADLGDAALAEWPDRPRLWERLLRTYLDRLAPETRPGGGSADNLAYLGYSDIVGQLRATLDVFDSLQVVSFGQVAAMLVAILLIVGPVDYFVTVRWLKRPHLSWYFASGVLLLTILGLSALYQQIRPSGMLINTAQIVDLDADSGHVNGRSWSHLYSGRARRVDVTARYREDSSQSAPIFTDWQGLPGGGLGGLKSELNTDRQMPAYEIVIDPVGNSSLVGVGIPGAGTKCLYSTWTDRIELQGRSNLREAARVDQLQGELVNPLPVDLRDAELFYHKWHYALRSRIPAGGSLTISFDMIPKDISRRLNDRKTIDGKVSTERWNPAERGALDRLLQLMMFYKAASGPSYTGLTHRYQPNIDQSNLLQMDRAILIGWVEQPVVEFDVQPFDATADREDRSDSVAASASKFEVETEKQRVGYRIIIPVASPE